MNVRCNRIMALCTQDHCRLIFVKQLSQSKGNINRLRDSSTCKRCNIPLSMVLFLPYNTHGQIVPIRHDSHSVKQARMLVSHFFGGVFTWAFTTCALGTVFAMYTGAGGAMLVEAITTDCAVLAIVVTGYAAVFQLHYITASTTASISCGGLLPASEVLLSIRVDATVLRRRQL